MAKRRHLRGEAIGHAASASIATDSNPLRRGRVGARFGYCARTIEGVIVVSDTSPILNLSAISHLHLLRGLFGGLGLPAELLERVDPGEAEAIIVAQELNASLILIDERRGRRIEAERGLSFTGLLGILFEAKTRNLIPECKPLLDGMILNAGLWVGNDLRTRFLRSLGEQP